MKRYRIIHACIALCAIMLAAIVSAPAQTAISLIEEEESFWNEFLSQEGIANKNLLHASFVAYRERMFDLSIESLRECMARNKKNPSVISIATYFLGKNNFQLGNFGEAIRFFAEARDMELGRFAYLRHVITLNMAIAYHRLGNTAHFRRLVQTVIEADAAGTHGLKAKELLNAVK